MQHGVKLRAFASGAAIKDVFAKITHEMSKMVAPFIFFVLLHAVVIICALMIKGTGISLPVSVFIASLILAKALLVADMLPLINRYPDRLLIWNASWKTLIYKIIASLFHFLERLFDYWKETHNVAVANRELLAHINWPQFWAI